jgi:hypothetical protein
MGSLDTLGSGRLRRGHVSQPAASSACPHSSPAQIKEKTICVMAAQQILPAPATAIQCPMAATARMAVTAMLAGTTRPGLLKAPSPRILDRIPPRKTTNKIRLHFLQPRPVNRLAPCRGPLPQSGNISLSPLHRSRGPRHLHEADVPHFTPWTKSRLHEPSSVF